MKSKLFGIFICTLLILSIVITVNANINQNIILNKNLPNNRSLSYKTHNYKSNLFGQKSLDIAVTNANPHQVSIFLGDGTGTFTYNGNSSTGVFPLAITGGDYNSDDNFDLVISNYDSDNITVLLGDGTGAFTSSGDFNVGASPFALVTEDFDKDNNLDISLVNMLDDTISVLFGDGTGGFGAQQIYTVGDNPADIVAGDFNKDNNCDLAVIKTYDNYINILFGDGLGGFSLSGSIFLGSQYHSYAMTKSDFNSDGNLDLTFSSSYYPYVGVILGDGTGGFGTLTNYTIGYGIERFDLVADDFNNDGNQDIAVPNTDENTVSVLLGDGTGSFGVHQTYDVGNYSVGIISGDFDMDNNVDLAVTNVADNTISVLLGDGTGSFNPQMVFYAGEIPAGIITADFDYTPVPNISCIGSLNWQEVKAGSTVNGTFQVSNIGDSGSFLNWEVDTFTLPNWSSSWTFVPGFGTGLAEGDVITITVEVVAPALKKKTFTGKIKMINSEDPTDFCEIDVSLTTPKLRVNQFVFIQRLLEFFPVIHKLIRDILAV